MGKARTAAPRARGAGGAAGGLHGAGKGVIYWFAVVFVAFVALNSLLFTSFISPDYNEVILYRTDWFWLTAPLCAALVWLVWLANRYQIWERVRPGILKKLLLAYTLAFGAAWVLLVYSRPVDDAALVFGVAQAFASGDYSALQPYGYMGVYPFQLGLAFYLELVQRAFGAQNFVAAQLLNVLWMTLAYQALVHLAALLFEESRATLFLTVFLLFLCLPPLFYTTFVYGLAPSLACALLAVCCTLEYLKKRRFAALGAAILLAALGNLFKNNTLIFAAGIFAALLLDLFKQRWRKTGWKQALCLLALAAAVLGAHKPVQAMYAVRSALPTQSGMPRVLWVAMALRPSERAPGWYNGISLHLYESSGYNGPAAAREGRRVIGQSFEEFGRDPAYAAAYFYKKAVSQWNEPSFASLWISHFDNPHARTLAGVAQSIYEGALNRVILAEMDLLHLVIYGFTLVFLLAKRKSLTLAQLLPALIMVGGFLFHTAWEAKSQYILPYYMLMLPYSAAGLKQAALWAGSLKERQKEKRAKDRG